MEHFLRTYGYAGVVLTTFLGAEEGVILSAFLAAEGYLSLPGIILASAIGGSGGDQIYYYLALRYGERIVNRFASLRRSYPSAQRLFKRYGALIVLASRFLAGIRIAVSVLCGAVRIPPLVYTPLSFLSGLIWATFYAVLSYRFGQELLSRLPETKHDLVWGFLIVGFAIVVVVRILSSRRNGTPRDPSPQDSTELPA